MPKVVITLMVCFGLSVYAGAYYYFVIYPEQIRKDIEAYYLEPFELESPFDRETQLFAIDHETISKLTRSYEYAIGERQQFESLIMIEPTDDGIYITIYNLPDKLVFEPGKFEFTDWGEYVISRTAAFVKENFLGVSIYMHLPKGLNYQEDYGAWELSNDYASLVKQALIHYSDNTIQFHRVSGFADRQLIDTHNPESPQNFRIEFGLTIPDEYK